MPTGALHRRVPPFFFAQFLCYISLLSPLGGGASSRGGILQIFDFLGCFFRRVSFFGGFSCAFCSCVLGGGIEWAHFLWGDRCFGPFFLLRRPFSFSPVLFAYRGSSFVVYFFGSTKRRPLAFFGAAWCFFSPILVIVFLSFLFLVSKFSWSF